MLNMLLLCPKHVPAREAVTLHRLRHKVTQYRGLMLPSSRQFQQFIAPEELKIYRSNFTGQFLLSEEKDSARAIKRWCDAIP